MTGTSESHDDDLPFLPPAPPTPPPPPPASPMAPSPLAPPGLRPPTPPTRDGDATEPEFDARAMVAAQRRAVPTPSYGSLPEGSDESRAAAQALRDDAKRKRHRNRRIGWLVALVFLAGIAAAGFLAWRAAQDDADTGAESELAESNGDGSDDEPADESGPASPLDEQTDVIDALDTLDDTGESGSGALGAIDDAQDAVDELDDEGSSRVSDSPASTEAPAGLPSTRSIGYFHRLWAAADLASPSVEYFVVYDITSDLYMADIRPSDGSGGTIIGTDPIYRNAIRTDDVVERVMRSALSLEPAPDFPLARVITIDDVVPPSAEPFVVPGNVAVAADGTSYGYEIDVVAWRSAAPDAYREWVALWNHPGPDAEALVEPDGRQIGIEEVDTSGLLQWAPDDATALPQEVTGSGAAVFFKVDATGQVTVAAIVDPESDFRSSYAFELFTDDPSMLDLGDQGWVDAP